MYFFQLRTNRSAIVNKRRVDKKNKVTRFRPFITKLNLYKKKFINKKYIYLNIKSLYKEQLYIYINN